jgi:UDP-glucuronate decarboxylase
MDAEDGRVISNFIMQALRGVPLTIYGEGRQTRSFCYVDDLIRAIVAMGNLEKNPGTPINIGNPNEFTVKELAYKVSMFFWQNSKTSIRSLPLPPDDPLQRKPDITLAKEILGWEPKIQLEEGLSRTIEWFRNELG